MGPSTPTDIAQQLDTCLDMLARGASVAECLRQYKDQAEALAPLLLAANTLRALPPAKLSATTRARVHAQARSAFTRQAQYAGMGNTVVQSESESFFATKTRRHQGIKGEAAGEIKLIQPELRGLVSWWQFIQSMFWQQRLPRAALQLALVALLMLTVGSGTLFAAEQSLPGQPLYAVKRAGEAVRLSLTLDSLSRAALHLAFAERRAAELQQLASTSAPFDQEVLGDALDHYAQAQVALASAAPNSELQTLNQATLTLLQASYPLVDQAGQVALDRVIGAGNTPNGTLNSPVAPPVISATVPGQPTPTPSAAAVDVPAAVQAPNTTPMPTAAAGVPTPGQLASSAVATPAPTAPGANRPPAEPSNIVTAVPTVAATSPGEQPAPPAPAPAVPPAPGATSEPTNPPIAPNPPAVNTPPPAAPALPTIAPTAAPIEPAPTAAPTAAPAEPVPTAAPTSVPAEPAPTPAPPLRSQPLYRYGWQVTTWNGAGQPERMIDDDPGSVWNSGEVQMPGQWVEIDMGQQQNFDSLMMDSTTSPYDYAYGFIVQVSDDGNSWSGPIASGAGTQPIINLRFAEQRARYVRIMLAVPAGPWWSINDIQLAITRR